MPTGDNVDGHAKMSETLLFFVAASELRSSCTRPGRCGGGDRRAALFEAPDWGPKPRPFWAKRHSCAYLGNLNLFIAASTGRPNASSCLTTSAHITASPGLIYSHSAHRFLSSALARRCTDLHSSAAGADRDLLTSCTGSQPLAEPPAPSLALRSWVNSQLRV